eukprot:m.60283 g.60283  ORF g.60283 m.60283 type:complete len:99 (+) comp11806_c0_seq5:961-1257(+)
MTQLSQNQNVYCKISGLLHPMYTEPGEWSRDGMKRWIVTAIDLFSPQRCMFASNFPVDRVCGSYKAMADAVKSILAEHLSLGDVQAVLHDTACAVYRL